MDRKNKMRENQDGLRCDNNTFVEIYTLLIKFLLFCYCFFHIYIYIYTHTHECMTTGI
jgi:hypothetical protein